jgi:hypothetical protein
MTRRLGDTANWRRRPAKGSLSGNHLRVAIAFENWMFERLAAEAQSRQISFGETVRVFIKKGMSDERIDEG